MPPTDKDRNQQSSGTSKDRPQDQNTRDLPNKDASATQDESVKGGRMKLPLD